MSMDILGQGQQLDPDTKAQLDEVDNVIARSVMAGDPRIAYTYGTSLQRQAAVKGLALAKLIYGIESNWNLFEGAGVEETFENFTVAELGVSVQTVRKYANMWKNVFAMDYIPAEIKNQLHSKPITELLLITKAVEEGSLTQEELETIAVSDSQTTHDIVRGARGEATSSKTAVILSIVMTDGKFKRGTVVASQDGETFVVGVLQLDSTITAVRKGVARIINSSGMMERD